MGTMSRCKDGRNYLELEEFAVVFWPRGVTKEMTQMVYNVFYNLIPCIKKLEARSQAHRQYQCSEPVLMSQVS